MKRFDEIRGTQIELEEAGVHPSDPPVMLLLKRKAIRIFNNNEKVALYGNEKLGIQVSIPYRSGHFSKDVPMAVREGLEEAVIHKLHHIAKTQTAADVVFKNGGTSRVDPATAHKIVVLHSKVDPSAKQKIEKLVNDSSAGLTKVAGFAIANMKA